MAIFVIAIIVCIILLYLWFKFIKVPKLTNLNFICGSIGTGKSFLTTRFGVSKYKTRVFILNLKRKLVYRNLIFVKKWKDIIINTEDILLYTDIPYDLKKAHIRIFDLQESMQQKKKVYRKVLFSNEIEKAHVLREKRFNYKSVVVFDEISVFFDQFDYDDKVVNEKLNNFFKLFRHETKGGLMVVNSQSVNDCHFALKNCLNQYFYIHHKKKLLFGMLLYVQELQYSNDNSVVNVNQGDIEDDAKLKLLWVSKKYFKYYDTYAHSWLTDYCKTYNFPYSNDYRLKSRNLWTFKLMSSLFDNVPTNELNQMQIDYINTSNIYRKSYELKKWKDLEKLKNEIKKGGIDNDKKENA